MSLFEHPEFHHHQQVVFCHDQAAGLSAIIAIHNTQRGPALGGCRMWPYPDSDAALTDVLRLSRGMTYKSAMADLPLGGGKSVIIGDPRRHKNEALLRAMGRFVDSLGGRYIAAEDAGTAVADIRIMGQETQHVAGILEKPGADGVPRSGDPSPATAYGVFVGLQAAVRHRLGRDDLQGLKVVVQGLGHVGFRLARLLHQAGARLWVCDLDPALVDLASKELGATPTSWPELLSLDVDVFAPCALGAVLNDQSIPLLKAAVVAGAANNQLASAQHGEMLRQRGVLYAPDYVINAGGIIDVALERRGFDRQALLTHLAGIGDTLHQVFQRADATDQCTAAVADQIAEERLQVQVSAAA